MTIRSGLSLFVELLYICVPLAALCLAIFFAHPIRWWRHRQILKDRALEGIEPLSRLKLDALMRMDKR